MNEIELLSYLLVFALSVIFTVYAIDAKKSYTFSFLSSLSWFTLSILHLILTYNSSFVVIALMFMGLGIMFAIYGTVAVIQLLGTKQHKKFFEE